MSTTRMAGADATWLHMDRPHNPMVVNTLAWWSGAGDLDQLAASFLDRVVGELPTFRSRPIDPPVTLGLVAPRWQAVPVDLDDHVRRVRLRSTDDGSLRTAVAEAVARPLDRRRPLWELHLIDRAGQGGAVLLRTHHALGDGPTLVHALARWSGQDEPRSPSRDRPRWRPSDAMATDADALAGLVAGLPRRTPVLGGALSGAKRVGWTAPVPIEAVRAVARRHHATINDVALAAMAAALRRAVPGAAGSTDVEAMVPVTLRGPDEQVAETAGNRFGLIAVPLPTAVGDPSGRIARVKAAMDERKASREASTVYGALTLLGTTPTPGAQAWVDAFTRRAAAVITNIVGPTSLTLGGAAVEGLVVWVPTTGPVGVGLSLCSFAGALRIGLIADDGILPDAEPLLGALDGELAALVPDDRS